MTPSTGRRRPDRTLDRLYQRRVGDVYRYALAMLQSPADAQKATKAVFGDVDLALQRGERPARVRAALPRMAHDACRLRFAGAQTVEDELDELHDPIDRSPACREAQLAVSMHIDRRLPRGERKSLRAHLNSCSDCATFAARLRAQRAALRSLAAVPVPAALDSSGQPQVF
jgi:hypothetical protein